MVGLTSVVTSYCEPQLWHCTNVLFTAGAGASGAARSGSGGRTAVSAIGVSCPGDSAPMGEGGCDPSGFCEAPGISGNVAGAVGGAMGGIGASGSHIAAGLPTVLSGTLPLP